MSNPAGRSDENPGFLYDFGHHGKNGGFLPKIFDDTRGGNMKLGEHMVGRPENGGSRRMGESGNGERKIREAERCGRGRSAA